MTPSRLRCLTGRGAKAPACFLVEIGGQRLLLDLGRTETQRPPLETIGAVDAVLITHQHPDHMGGLDALADAGDPPVYATPTVAAAILREHGVKSRSLPLQGHLQLGDVRIQTGRDGHAPGGVWLHLDDGRCRLLYCGDVMPTGDLFPFDPPPPAATAIIDASYGLSNASPAAQREAMDALFQSLSGPVLLPAPAAGRALELALLAGDLGLPTTLCGQTRAAAAAACVAQDVLQPAARDALAALLVDAGALTSSPASGVTLVDDPSAERACTRNLVERLAHGVGHVVFTGHLPDRSAAAALVRHGRARHQRWPVHPTLSENAALLDAVDPERVIAAFCDPALYPELGRQLGRQVVAESEVPL